jgi:hypothetical protein
MSRTILIVDDDRVLCDLVGELLRGEGFDVAAHHSGAGGVDFSVWRGLAVGPNISYMKFFGGAGDIDLTRIGARMSYRF